MSATQPRIPCPLEPAGFRRGLGILFLSLLVSASGAIGDTYPPDWNGGGDPPVHFAPVAWPADDGDGLLDFGDWVPYTILGSGIEDNGVQDPSNGGTSPQNYVNASSGCTDLTLPSVFVYYDSANQVLMFRWRVEQIANTYATGPTTGSASSVDPWKSALWTVLIDTDGDGYRDYAVQVDGSSGSPGTEVDQMKVIFSESPDQSLDYTDPDRPDICEVAHNPTAFTDDFAPAPGPTGNILNFQNSVTPTWIWGNGANETVWDYGTTRARKLDQGTCVEYFVDYQIPLAALDASSTGDPDCTGEAVTEDTPICLLFTTSNSLENPLQKDVVMEAPTNPGDTCILDPEEPAPFGDCFSLGDFDAGTGDLGTIDQPIVPEVTADGCDTTTLTATIVDTADGTDCYTGSTVGSTVNSVQFYYYYDADGNGVDDDGNVWTAGPVASLVAGTVNQWQAAGWDTTVLRQGNYLIGVRAEDDQGNVTWSHLTQAEVDAMFPGDNANPAPSPGELSSDFLNVCGTFPTVTKSASVSEVAVGGTVDFTITVTAATDQALTLDQIDDFLPSGWTFNSFQGGTLSPDSTTPTQTPTASGTTLTWTFMPATNIAAGASGTLIFRAIAPAVEGTYQNQAQILSSNEGTLTSNKVEVGVGAPVLSLTKTPDAFSATPGDTVTYTIIYGNASPVTVTNAVLTDVVPAGLTFSSATDGGTYDSGTRTVTWTIGTLATGSTGNTVSFSATVDSPYPSGAANPLVNTATIDSDDTTPLSADAPIFISLPLRVQKTASVPTVTAGGNVTFTISYENTSTQTAINAIVSDVIPAGFTYQGVPGGQPVPDGAPPVGFTGTLTWSLGNLPGAPGPGNTGSVQVILQAASPFTAANPATNSATFDSDNFSPVSDTYEIPVTGVTCAIPTTFYMSSTSQELDSTHTGTELLADTTAPVGTASTTGLVTVGPTVTNIQELIRFYQDPPYTEQRTFSLDVTATLYLSKDGSPQATFRLELFDFDPVSETAVSLGFNEQNVTGNTSNDATNFTITQPAATIAAGHRLLWVVSAYADHNNQSVEAGVNYDGAASTSVSDVCTDILQTAINKSVDKLSVTSTPAPLQTLAYTIEFTNVSAGTVTGGTVVDDLPVGVTYDAAFTPLLNGLPTAVPSISGQTLTFSNVNGAGDLAGTISGGNTGTLVFQVTVDNPATATSSTLVNTATLETVEADDVSDTAVTNLLRPNIVVTKAVSPTLLLPGDTTTFTVTITNAGTATAFSISMTDTLPVQSYFVYVSCAIDASAAPTTTANVPPDAAPACGFADPTLSATAGRLAAGETLVVTFDMQATTVPAPPAGFTTETNLLAQVSITGEPNVVSGPASVTISTAPNLEIDLTVDKATVGTSEVVTYTIVVTNTGFADALDVLVSNPIPGLTEFVSGSLTYEGGMRTDASDGDNAYYNLIANQLEWDLGTLPDGESRTLTFQVITDSTLPAGSTLIPDTATVESSNTASKQDTETITANAAPVFTFSKSAPATMALPLTTLNGNHNNVTTVNVNDASLLSVNDWIFIGGDVGTQILAISGNTLTVSVPISGNNGSPVEPVIPYVIRYRNTGDADATNVVITDTLPDPAGTPISELVAVLNGGTGDGGSPETVTWNLGTVAAGASGSVRMWVHPTEADSYTNTATLTSDQTAPTSDDATTEIGVLTLTKSTSTPSVTSDTTDPKTVASYTLTITSAVAASGVEITDRMEPGFTFCDAGSTDATCANPTLNPARTTATSAPVDGDNTLVWCCWDLAANDTVTITYDARLGFAVGSGTYQNDIEITSSNPSLDFDFLATSAEDVTVTFIGPNYVLLSEVSAALAENGVELRWTTDAELGTAGFRVLRVDPQLGYVPVKGGVLPAEMSPQGASYRLLDRDASPAGPLAYVLQEVLSNGAHRTYGPFLVDPFAGAAGPRLAEGFAGTPRTKAKPSSTPSSEGIPGLDRGPGTGLRIGVREEGLYRVAAETIDAALGLKDGEASSLIRSGKLQLLNNDVEVPWTAEGGGHATGLLFYGQGIRSRYSNERIYRLLPTRGERMKNASGGGSGAATPNATFRDTVRVEQDLRPVLIGEYADDTEFWVWWFLVGGSGTWGAQSFTLDAPGAVTTVGGTAELTVGLLGTSVTGAGAHHVEAYVNGVAVGDGRFRNYESAELVFNFPASVLQAGANTVELVALLDPGVGFSLLALDHFELAYDRDYVASSLAFAFGSAEHEQLVVDGFDDPEILVLEVSDPADPREVQGTEVEPGTLGAYQVRFSPATANGRYLAAVAGGVREPSSIEVDHPSSLRDASNWADYVVITATELMTSAEALANHRAAQGLRSMVVDVDDVMDEFNGGQLDPEAIRTFLAYAAANWVGSASYVALVGEGTVDYKDAWGLGTNLLPPLVAASGWGLYASDNRLADLDGDGVPDLAVGRLTVTSAAQLDAVVAKIVAYETASDAAWMSDVVLLADDPDATGQYTLASEAYAGLLPAGAAVHRIYLEHKSPASASAELLGWLASGTSLVSFLGHAGLTQLTHENVLSSGHVAGLANGERLPVISAMSCNLGNFSLPGFPSLAEDLVLHPGGGAIAVWTAVGLSYNPRRVVLGEAFLTAISDGRAERLGDAVLYALRVGAANPLAGRETLETQVLLGDPALRLRIVPTP